MTDGFVNEAVELRNDPHKFGALSRVCLHQCGFLIGEAAFLSEKRCELFMDFADIVKKRRCFYLFNFPGG